MLLIQGILNGLATGSIYALVALGIVLIYKATGTINFAQGEILMVSCFIGFTLVNGLHVALLPAFIVTLLFAALFGMVLERLVIRPAIHAPPFNIIIITIGVSIVLQILAGSIWTFESMPFPNPFSEEPIRFGSLVLSPLNLGTIFTALGLMIVLFIFFKYAKLGKAMRAVSQNQRASSLMGISVERIFSLIWAISSAIGAAGGFLIAPRIFLNPNMGLIAINAFAGAILGGFDSLPGAVFGGMLLGVLENLAPLCIPSRMKFMIPFLALIIVLMIRPSGLFGKRIQKKV